MNKTHVAMMSAAMLLASCATPGGNPETTDERKYQNFEQVTNYICDHAQAGDLVITLGCGDVNKVNKMILEELERRQSAK